MSETTVSYTDLSSIVRTVNQMSDAIVTVDRHVSQVYDHVGVLQQDLEQLKASFRNMMEENRRQAALQRALTEIIRVRQELERDFGNYKLVRNTMLGILEATDLLLVRETTIATCTEELMLSTPRYWLAPVLIALSAWISDNKALANRALKEALRRDYEKTCLTFALICRRNKRTNACFVWLSRYFAKQKADDMKESIIAYIDAYTNGVFGEDRDNLCEEYIENWMGELQSKKPNFEEDQISYWKQQYQLYCKDQSPKYPELAACSKTEFAKMNEYLQRIDAAPEIIKFFSDILGTEVDRLALASAIDNELIKLVKNYDVDEAPLREEEEYLTDIKNSNGNEAWAKQRRELRRASRADRHVDLAQRLSDTIVSNSTEDISAKKTAIRFMQDYIKAAFKEFMAEKEPSFPKEITVTTHEWTGKTKDGSNRKELLDNYEATINSRREKELATVKNTPMIVCFVLAAVCLVLGIVGVIPSLGLIALGVIGFILTVIFVIAAFVVNNNNKKKRAAINQKYDEDTAKGKSDIENTLKQYSAVCAVVNAFDPEANYEQLLLTEGN